MSHLDDTGGRPAAWFWDVVLESVKTAASRADAIDMSAGDDQMMRGATDGEVLLPRLPDRAPVAASPAGWGAVDRTVDARDAAPDPAALVTVPPLSGPTLPTPTLPTLPPAAPPGPPAAPVPFALVPPPFAPNHRSQPAAPGPRRLVRALVVLAVVGVIAGGAVFVARGIRAASALPTFPAARPAYGSVAVAFEETVEGVPVTGTVAAGADPGVFVYRSGEGAAGTTIVSDGQQWFSVTGVEWTPIGRTGDLADAIASVALVAVYADYVPDSVRPFAEMVDRQDVEVLGRDMEQIEVFVDIDAFEAASPAESATWRDFVGVEQGDLDGNLARLVLTVDDDGVVWVFRTWGEDESASNTYRMLSYSTDEFVPPARGTAVGAAVADASPDGTIPPSATVGSVVAAPDVIPRGPEPTGPPVATFTGCVDVSSGCGGG